jgi:hypothetical protein
MMLAESVTRRVDSDGPTSSLVHSRKVRLGTGFTRSFTAKIGHLPLREDRLEVQLKFLGETERVDVRGESRWRTVRQDKRMFEWRELHGGIKISQAVPRVGTNVDCSHVAYFRAMKEYQSCSSCVCNSFWVDTLLIVLLWIAVVK